MRAILIPTHIYLQNLASIQPRTSPLKFAASRDAHLASRDISRHSPDLRVGIPMGRNLDALANSTRNSSSGQTTTRSRPARGLDLDFLYTNCSIAVSIDCSIYCVLKDIAIDLQLMNGTFQVHHPRHFVFWDRWIDVIQTSGLQLLLTKKL